MQVKRIELIIKTEKEPIVNKTVDSGRPTKGKVKNEINLEGSLRLNSRPTISFYVN